MLSKEQKMCHSTYFISRVLSVVFTVCFAVCFSATASAQALPSTEILKYEAKPVSTLQVDSTQLLLIERRAIEENKLVRNVINILLAMFLFGVFCALWAQNSQRNPVLWFLCGFAFNLVTVLSILFWFNPKNRHRRRYRRIPTCWPVAHH